MAKIKAAGGHADVRATLRRVEGERRFVIENVGAKSAGDVRFTIEPTEGRNTPLVASEHKAKFPIAKLAPGKRESLRAIITTGTGLRFRCRLDWSNPDGSHGTTDFMLSV